MGDAAPVLSRQRRRWCFANMVFDEAGWVLSVDGTPVDIETKPLEVLRELLLRPGEVVTKSELLDAVWPRVTVVEASLSTAVRKLRRAFATTDGADAIIETVSGLGYRLNVPVTMEVRPPHAIPLPEPSPAMAEAAAPSRYVATADRSPDAGWSSRRRWSAAAACTLVLLGGGLVAPRLSLRAATAATPADMQRDAKDALRTLDQPRIETLLRQGWNPNAPFDDEGNAALGILLNVCDWNPDHDKQKLLVVARTLYDAGARVDVRNVWGDTPYSIAKAKRYCGPDHPVTLMLHKICFAELHPLGEKCLAGRPRRTAT